MPFADRFGLELTTQSDSAAADYREAVDLMLAANVGAEALFDRALAADPDFALAQIARARLLQVQARVPEARDAAAAARALKDRVTPREVRHIETIASAIDGAGPRAMALLAEHVSEYPRDAMVLGLALGVYGLLGFGGRADFPEVQLALLERLAPAWPEDWWFLTYLGWARIETGDVARGMREVERALLLNSANAFAAHAVAHGHFEAGEAEAGAAFIDAWLPGYARQGLLHGHLSWHLALFELARGNSVRAAGLYDDAIRPAACVAPPLFALADAASFLWRWRLYGEDPPLDAAWGEVAALVQQSFPRAGLHFADIHAALAEAATGDGSERIAQTEERAASGQSPQGAVVPALCAGAAAFAAGDYARAADRLGAVLLDLARVGGSHAQREVFEDTYIVACLRARRTAAAKERLEQRLARRPSARDRRWLAATTAG